MRSYGKDVYRRRWSKTLIRTSTRLLLLLPHSDCNIWRREGSYEYEMFSFWKREISDGGLREVWYINLRRVSASCSSPTRHVSSLFVSTMGPLREAARKFNTTTCSAIDLQRQPSRQQTTFGAAKRRRLTYSFGEKHRMFGSVRQSLMASIHRC